MYYMSTNNEKYLVLRGKNKDIYFIQKRLTKEQSDIIGKNFIKKSLETTDLTEAIIKRDEILSEIEQICTNKEIKAFNNKIDPIKVNYSTHYTEEKNDRVIESREFTEENSKIDENNESDANMIKVNVPMNIKDEDSNYEYKENKRYTIFSLKIPKFPEKDDLVIKIDKIVPIAIVIITLFIAFIA